MKRNLRKTLDGIVFNGYTVPNHNLVTYHIFASFSAYLYDFTSYASTWNASPKITIVNNSGASTGTICVDGALQTAAGAYAITYHHPDGTSTIIFYSSYATLSDVRRHETVIHEVGHCLGLAHCQPANNSISVMREFDFNDVETPLSDDWAGINALY